MTPFADVVLTLRPDMFETIEALKNLAARGGTHVFEARCHGAFVAFRCTVSSFAAHEDGSVTFYFERVS